MPMNPASPSEPKARVAIIASVAFALLIAVSVATPLPAIAQEALYPWAKTLDSYVDPEGDYYLQRLGDLFSDGLVTVVDDEPAAEPDSESGTEPEPEGEGEGGEPAVEGEPEGEGEGEIEGEPAEPAEPAVETAASRIKVSVDEKSGAMVVTGQAEDLTSVSFAIDKEYDFDENLVSRFSLDASSAKGQRVKLGFFLDNAEGDASGDGAEPFATLTLTKQRDKSGWACSKENSQDVTEHAISGEHRISFRVLDCSDGKVSFCVKSFEMCQSVVPTVYFEIDESEGTVDAMNASEDHSVECYGNMRICVPEGYQSEYAGAGEGAGEGANDGANEGTSKSGVYEMEYIRGRGNSTWGAAKKPYKVKLASKADLFGMGASKHWALLANVCDNSLLRNKLTYALGDQLGAESGISFTPQSVAVDVVMNGQYYGSYVLSEQVRAEKSRVDIRDLTKEKYQTETDESQIDGGYLLSWYGHADSSTKKKFTTKRGLPLLLEAPEFDGYYSDAQLNYIRNYCQSAEDALYSDDFRNAEGRLYKEYIDLDSAAMYYWVQEFTRNGDGYITSSTYMYKDHDGKLRFGPLWDFDYVAWGSTEYGALETVGWVQNHALWIDRMLDDPEFTQRLQELWPVFKEKLQDVIADGGTLDQYADATKLSAAYNFEKWGPSFFGSENDGEHVAVEDSAAQPGLSYSDEINRLKDWAARRMAWVDDHLGTLTPQEATVKFYDADDNLVEERTGLVGRDMGNLPAAPERPGYVFEGWHYSYELTLEEYFATMGHTEESFRAMLEEQGASPEEIEDIISGFSDCLYNEDTVAVAFNVAKKEMELIASYIEECDLVKATGLFTDRERYNLRASDETVYGETDASIVVTLAPREASGSPTFVSSDASVATVNRSGYVESVAPGHCTVTISAYGGISKTVDVYVYSDEQIAEMENCDDASVEVPEKASVACGKFAQIVATPCTEHTLAKLEANYRSCDTDIVEVNDSGVIHGVKEGKTHVLRIDDSNVSIIEVTVTKAPLEPGYSTSVNGIKYQVLSIGKSGYSYVKVTGVTKKMSSAYIPSTVKFRGKTFRVSRIAPGAFMGDSKVKYVRTGKYLKGVGDNAFYKCKNLAKVRFTSKKKPTIGYRAFSSVKKGCKFYVPKSQKSYYKKVLKGKRIRAF